MTKNYNFGHVLVYLSILNLFRLNFAVAKKLYFAQFLQIKIVAEQRGIKFFQGFDGQSVPFIKHWTSNGLKLLERCKK